MRIEIDKSEIEKHKGKIKFLVILIIGIIFLSIAFSIIQREDKEQEVKVEKIEVKEQPKVQSNLTSSEQASIELMQSFSSLMPVMIVVIVGITLILPIFRVFRGGF